MQVLFRGTPPGEQEYAATCHNCKSIVKFKAEETKATFGNDRYILCPVCSRGIFSSSFVKLSQTKPIVPLSISPDPYDVYEAAKKHRDWYGDWYGK